MSSIPPTLKYIEGFTVTGVSTKTQNTDEFNEKKARLPSLWQQFYSSDLAAAMQAYLKFIQTMNLMPMVYTLSLLVSVMIVSVRNLAPLKFKQATILFFTVLAQCPPL